MGNLTLENFRAELLFDLKNRTDTSTSDGLSTTRQDLFINAGYLHITHPSVFRHREMQATSLIALVVGTNQYTFSPLAGVVTTGVRYCTHVTDLTDAPTATHTKLFPRDEQWFQGRTLNSGGSPRDYATRGNTLIVSPVPGANEAATSLVVGIWREPTLLVAGATTVLSTRWDEIVLLAARWRAELHLGYREAKTTKIDLVSLINEYKSHEDLHGEDWDWQSGLVSESSMESV